MSIEARQIQETLYSYAAILNFTPSPQGLRAKFGACSVQNAQLFTRVKTHKLLQIFKQVVTTLFTSRDRGTSAIEGAHIHIFGSCLINFF